MRGRQPETRALHKRLAPGRCVERSAAQKDALSAGRGRQRRRRRRRGQTRPIARPTGAGPAAAEGGNHEQADVRVKLAKMSMSDLKKLCNTMNVYHSLSRDKTTLVDTFMQQLDAAGSSVAGLVRVGDRPWGSAAEEATSEASQLFPPAQPPSQPPPGATGPAAAAAAAPPPPPPPPPPATGAAAAAAEEAAAAVAAFAAAVMVANGTAILPPPPLPPAATGSTAAAASAPAAGTPGAAPAMAAAAADAFTVAAIPLPPPSATPSAPRLPPSLALPTRAAVLWSGPKWGECGVGPVRPPTGRCLGPTERWRHVHSSTGSTDPSSKLD